MTLLIKKFGGTSLGSLERIQAVAKQIAASKAQGHNIVVVVSAMNGETNRLIQMSEKLVTKPEPREYDALLATGEQVSAALLSMALQTLNIHALSYTALQIGLQTQGVHQRAIISNIDNKQLQTDLENDRVPVVAGFQGMNEDNYITTLGRGGSDITAVALAAILQADECQIYTDVEGIYSADPRIVKKARFLTDITIKEMVELSALGANVLHPRAVQLASRYTVPVRVLSSFKPGEGTLIDSKESQVEKPCVSGVAFERNYIRLILKSLTEHQAELINRIMASLALSDIHVDHIAQHADSDPDWSQISLIFQAENSDQIHQLLQEHQQELNHVALIEQGSLAKLSVVGHGVGSSSAIAAKLYALMQKDNILVHTMMRSSSAISLLVDMEAVEEGVRKVHDYFIE